MNEELREPPSDILSLKKQWVAWADFNAVLHYTCSIVGVASSCVAASSWPFARVAAVISAVCFGVLGFVRPFRIWHQFISAARTLDYAIRRYRHNLIDIATLIDALHQAEMHIQRYDEEYVKEIGQRKGDAQQPPAN